MLYISIYDTSIYIYCCSIYYITVDGIQVLVYSLV